jgi:hypothetical protein
MKKLVYSLFAVIILSMVFFACGGNENKENKSQADSSQVVLDSTKSDSSCSSETIMDPNNAKPMALMMRALVKNASEMREKLKAGETLETAKYPLVRFWLVEPTDPDVLEPQFFENARLFSESYKKLSAASDNASQIKAYNAVIGMCINCHESYCSGPLKRIRKLPI